MGIGGVLAFGTAALHLAVPAAQRGALAALLLAAIGAIYVGFAIADGGRSALVLEVGGAVVFLFIAALSLWVSPTLLVLGYVLHGFWDYAHHRRLITTTIRRWYPPFCAIYDWVLAGLLLVLLR
jgi:hypothetical protein